MTTALAEGRSAHVTIDSNVLIAASGRLKDSVVWEFLFVHPVALLGVMF